MKKITIFFLAFSFIALSCKTKKVVTDTSENAEARTASFLMKKLVTNQIQADWMTGKMKLKVRSQDLPGGGMSLTGNIRMKKKEAIWMNVKAFGFEVARVLIEPDSIFVIDRFGGNNVKEDLSYIQKKMNFPANFEMLEAIMLGNPVFFTKDFEAKLDSSGYQMYSETSSPKSNYYISPEDFLIDKMLFEETNPQRKMQIVQEKYQTVEKNGSFPYFRNFEMNSAETGDISLKIDFSNIEFDKPAKMPFDKTK